MNKTVGTVMIGTGALLLSKTYQQKKYYCPLETQDYPDKKKAFCNPRCFQIVFYDMATGKSRIRSSNITKSSKSYQSRLDPNFVLELLFIKAVCQTLLHPQVFHTSFVSR